MLKVLIVDDTQEKIVKIRQVLDGYVDNPDDVPICCCTRDALKACAKIRYDLVILDLFVPHTAGKDPDPKNAQDFLRIIKDDSDCICPVFVIAITHVHDISVYKSFFEAETMFVLNYSENDDTWRSQLRNRLDYLSGIKRKFNITYDYDYDVAIVNALQTPEHDEMKKTLKVEWTEVNLDDDNSTTYYESVLKISSGKTIRCISCYATQMASVASATMATKLILRFHPRYLFMTGICAGLKGNGIGYGDVLIASQVWDGMSGKFKERQIEEDESETIFEPDYRQISINPAVENIFNRIKDNKALLESIKNNFEGEKPETPLGIHIGPMTSVPAVIASEKKISDLKAHARKLIGIEMESYGVMYAAEHAHSLKPVYTVSIKSASDLADRNKTDKYQDYASYTSAALMKYIIENELSFD